MRSALCCNLISGVLANRTVGHSHTKKDSSNDSLGRQFRCVSIELVAKRFPIYGFWCDVCAAAVPLLPVVRTGA